LLLLVGFSLYLSSARDASKWTKQHFINIANEEVRDGEGVASLRGSRNVQMVTKSIYYVYTYIALLSNTLKFPFPFCFFFFFHSQVREFLRLDAGDLLRPFRWHLLSFSLFPSSVNAASASSSSTDDSMVIETFFVSNWEVGGKMKKKGYETKRKKKCKQGRLWKKFMNT